MFGGVQRMFGSMRKRRCWMRPGVAKWTGASGSLHQKRHAQNEVPRNDAEGQLVRCRGEAGHRRRPTARESYIGA